MKPSWNMTLMLSSLVSLMLSQGCAGGPRIPATFPVTGKVLYKGAPLVDAEVSFVSKLDNQDVRPANGRTDADGEFSLTTYIDPQHEVEGATAGQYTVTVNKVETMSDEEMMKQFQKNPSMTFKPLVPTRYTVPSETPLVASVEAGGKNHFEFTLEE
ncbi:MAG: hypothetical protein ACKO3T_01310 [Planctomycetaceae bacterium]